MRSSNMSPFSCASKGNQSETRVLMGRGECAKFECVPFFMCIEGKSKLNAPFGWSRGVCV